MPGVQNALKMRELCTACVLKVTLEGGMAEASSYLASAVVFHLLTASRGPTCDYFASSIQGSLLAKFALLLSGTTFETFITWKAQNSVGRTPFGMPKRCLLWRMLPLDIPPPLQLKASSR